MPSKSFPLKGRTFRTLLSFLFLACFASEAISQRLPPTPPLEKDGNLTDIPFHFTSDRVPRIVIYLRINSSKLLPFLLDTGFNGSLALSGSVARELKLTPGAVRSKPGDRGVNPVLILRSVDFPSVRSSSQLTIRNIPAQLGNWNFESVGKTTIAGLVGVSIFAERILSVDFDRRVLTLSQNTPIWKYGIDFKKTKIRVDESWVGVCSSRSRRHILDVGAFRYRQRDHDLAGSDSEGEREFSNPPG